jgi:hypothetical protein
MNRRLDIYLSGTHGLKEVATDMLLSWRQVPALARKAWRTTTALFWDLLPLLLALLGPLLVVVAPVLALVLAHRVTGEDDDIRIQGVFDREGDAA